MSDKAAKFIMYGMFAIAGSYFVSGLINNETSASRYKIISYYRMFDSKTGTMYLSDEEDEQDKNRERGNRKWVICREL